MRSLEDVNRKVENKTPGIGRVQEHSGYRSRSCICGTTTKFATLTWATGQGKPLPEIFPIFVTMKTTINTSTAGHGIQTPA